MSEKTTQLAEQKDQKDIVYKTPRVDIYEGDTEVLLVADMPGVAKDKVDVELVDGKISISGMRPSFGVGKETWQEFTELQYHGLFSLSKDLDVETIRADYADGVLQVRIAHKKEVQPRVITVH